MAQAPFNRDWRSEFKSKIQTAVQLASGIQDYTRSKPPRRRAAIPGIVPFRLVTPKPVIVALVLVGDPSTDASFISTLQAAHTVLYRALAHQPVRILTTQQSLPVCQQVPGWTGVELVRYDSDTTAILESARRLRPRCNLVVIFTDGKIKWPVSAPPGLRVVVGVVGADGPNLPQVKAVPAWGMAVPIPFESVILPIISDPPQE